MAAMWIGVMQLQALPVCGDDQHSMSSCQGKALRLQRCTLPPFPSPTHTSSLSKKAKNTVWINGAPAYYDHSAGDRISCGLPGVLYPLDSRSR